MGYLFEEALWVAAVIATNSSHINQYLQAKKRIEHLVLAGDYSEALTKLATLGNEVSVSSKALLRIRQCCEIRSASLVIGPSRRQLHHLANKTEQPSFTRQTASKRNSHRHT
jgi:hypothetical protein